ncbi:MAG: class I mannose-6-phosphate isomerase [Thermoleophilia bacterium]|nr:class I mannose-6-phosphate isomerase [Thermoleophilia bacterium]
MTDPRLTPLRMTPDLRVRPWAGDRLAPADQGIGEAWLAGPWSAVAEGPFSGRTLGELAAELGEPLIGTRGAIHGRGGFPVLVKLIDAAEWLSVQVHPDDAQALELEGEPGIGKAEAWLVLDAAPEAELLLGRRADADPEAVRAAIGSAGLMDLLERIAIQAGDCLDVPAGMLHAIGPGTFVYEIQQPCDITYRVWDWGRTDRTIHVEQSRRVADPALRGLRRHVPTDAPDAVVAASPFFLARQVLIGPGGTSGATDGSSPHVVTVLDGSADLVTDHGATRLARYETVVLPAATGGYRLDGSGPARVVVATVP